MHVTPQSDAVIDQSLSVCHYTQPRSCQILLLCNHCNYLYHCGNSEFDIFHTELDKFRSRNISLRTGTGIFIHLHLTIFTKFPPTIFTSPSIHWADHTFYLSTTRAGNINYIAAAMNHTCTHCPAIDQTLSDSLLQPLHVPIE